MKRLLYFGYGVVNHLVFLAIFAYLAAFVAGVLVPKTIDSPSDTPLAAALAINSLLIALFGMQHSIMARPGFKKMWTRIVPEPIERSTYVLASNLVTAILLWQWRGIDIVVWNVEQPIVRATIWMLFVAGWLLVPLATFLIHHFDLFGTRQVWLHLRRREYTSLPFRTPSLYRHVRHPLYVGWTIAFWATPTMTVGHLLFAGLMTTYIAIAVVFEERDLVAHFGQRYEEYRRRVPMFLPRWFKCPAEERPGADAPVRDTGEESSHVFNAG